MKGEKIEILRDPSAANQGDAIIRLVGLFELPDSPVFKIESLDEVTSQNGAPGWPQGELKARHMRVGEAGVELIVGSDVVDAPALLPGTPVAISVPSASLRKELRWPTLLPVKSPKRNVVVVSAEKRRAEIAARAKARRAELENMAAVRMAAEAAASAARGKSQLETDAPMADEQVLFRLDAKRKGAVKLVSSREENTEPPALRKSIPSARVVPVVSSTAAPILPPLPKITSPAASAVTGSATQQSGRMSAAAPLATPRREMVGPIPVPGTPAELSLPGFHAKTAAAAALNLSSVEELKRSPPPQPIQSDPPPLPLRQTPTAPPPVVARSDSGAPPIPPDTPRFLMRTGNENASQPSFKRAFGMGFLIAAALALISVFAMNRSGMLLGDAARVGAVNPVAASQPEESLKTLSAVLAVPDVSTNGTDATSVDLAGALNRADDLLSTGESGDKEEAKYWLRRALAQGLSEKRMVWAMTQLGTLYAAPMSGAPDYAAARSVWELAAAQGDPVALCFLAALHEHGLGVPADEVRALVLYRNAKAEGGCRNVDASIQRLSKGTP